MALPRFDKTRDDRSPAAEWPRVAAPASIVILEGWCVGAEPGAPDALAAPVNDLERREDGDGRWRRHVNAALAGPYRRLFGRLDHRVLLRAPDFAHVHAWRLEQERGLARTPGQSLPVMDADAVARFIAHYERLTRSILVDEPADLVIDISAERTPIAWRAKRPASGR